MGRIHCEAVVLDAMGVMYRHGDDVGELLVPFLRGQGSTADTERIGALYHEASLGRMTPAAFWQALDLDPGLEDRYLEDYQLSPGLEAFLQWSAARPLPVWCLSNDLEQWSGKLRRRFMLEPYFTGWVISGAVGIRKPDPGIYQRLLEHTGMAPRAILFIDDRPANLDAARALGMRTFLFDPAQASSNGEHPVVPSFAALTALLS